MQRFFDLLKCGLLAVVLLNVACAMGCGDGANVETAVSERTSGGPEDPAANPNWKPAQNR